jgi:hypothetical protein
MMNMKTIEVSDNTQANIETLEKVANALENDLGLCILWVLDDAPGNTNAYRIAKGALSELAALEKFRADVLAVDTMNVNVAEKWKYTKMLIDEQKGR